MNSLYIKSELAKLALRNTPSIIRKELLADPSFLSEYDFEDATVFFFAEIGVSLYRSDLFDAVRVAMSNSAAEVTDFDGQVWQVKNVSDLVELPTFELSKGDMSYILPELSVLSGEEKIRLRSFNEMVADVNLPAVSKEKWQKILIERELKDYEVDPFLSDFRNTPIEVARSIRNQIASTHINIRISTLIPSSREYYERLVGIYDGSTNVRDYATKVCRTFFHQLSGWQPGEGFLLSLLLTSHSSLSDQIDVSQLSDKEFVDSLNFVEKSGDRISQMGAIEVGLRVVQIRPTIKPHLIRLIQMIFDDKVDQSNSSFRLISGLFFLVDGELSRTRLFSTEPPFYRRLAALSHAALIQRQLVSSSIDKDLFYEWAVKNGGAQFFVQNLVDMRLEPRWNPDYALPMQIKADFIGRLTNATRRFEQETGESELSNLVLTNTMSAFDSDNDLIRLYLSGPLEGNIESINTIPPEMVESIQSQLSNEEVSPMSFIALVNSALLFRADVNQAELAANALKFGSHRLKNIEDKTQLISLLDGLATVAAVSRSRLLADEVRILVRRYRYDPQFALSIMEAIRICLKSSACIVDLIEWRNYLGDWLTELAFGDLLDQEDEVLVSYLHYLLYIVPELWISCGRADAALKAFISS